MAWVQKASKETFSEQYQAFIQDIFWHLNTAVGAERLTTLGFNLDNTLLDDLRIVNFVPLNKDDPNSVQRSADLNLVHKGSWGRLKS